MTTFILSEEPSTIRKVGWKEIEHVGRVILDWKSHGRALQTIEAEPVQQGSRMKSAWCVARDQVDETKFCHIGGRGWLSIESLLKVRRGQ